MRKVEINRVEVLDPEEVYSEPQHYKATGEDYFWVSMIILAELILLHRLVLTYLDSLIK
jgi:hypothetical protein